MRVNTDRVVSLSALLVGVGNPVYGERWRVSSDSVVPKQL
jgi:hypothetical protein